MLEKKIQNFDVIIVGSGSGNSLITEDFTNLKVALVEGGIFGGTCLNVGCIPTKMYVYTADIAAKIRDAANYGINATLNGTDWKTIRERIFSRIDPISSAGLQYRKKDCDNVQVFTEYATFVSTHKLKLTSGTEITAPTIVIAAGSRPTIPKIVGLFDSVGQLIPGVYTSDTIMKVDNNPKRLLIVGGGYIGSEFAHIFHALGTKVTQIARSEQLLKNHDVDISKNFTNAAKKQWKVVLGQQILQVSRNALEEIVVKTNTDNYVVDAILLATGRTANVDTLNLAEVGYDITNYNSLTVNCYQQALSKGKPVPGIWALGDISSKYQLKHVANHEARIVAHNMFNSNNLHTTDHRYVPSAVFSYPQIASVGLTEQEAQQQKQDYVKSVQEYGSTAYGWAMEDTVGFVKIIAHRTSGKILGAHIMGDMAATLLQPLIQAISLGQDCLTVARKQYWIHPALSEVIENALLALPIKNLEVL